MKDYYVTGWLPSAADVRTTPSGREVLDFFVRLDRDEDESPDAEQALERFRIDDPAMVRRLRGELLTGRAVTIHARRCLITISKSGGTSTIPGWEVREIRVPNRSAPPKTVIHPALQDAAKEDAA